MSGIPLTGLIPLHLCACPKPQTEFQTSYVVIFVCSVSLSKMRDDCSFCGYWWNWWSQLFKL